MGLKTRAGLSWNLLGAVVTNGTRVVVLAVLGRALTSNDFGIVAVAVSVNTILYSVRDVGVGTAIVQRKSLLPEHITTAFAFSTYMGLALSVVLFVTAPVIGDDLFGIPESVDVIRVLGALFALRGFSTTSRMLAQRAMAFRMIAVTETGAYAVGSTVSIILAIQGAGPWALVAGYLVEELLVTGLFLVLKPSRMSLAIDGARLRELLGFGTRQMLGQVIGTIGTNADNFIVGKNLGSVQLGYYARAYDLIKLPATVFSTVVGTVLFPAFAKLQDDRLRMATNYRRITFVNALVLLPASAVLIVLGPEMIRILMGAGWDTAVLPFQILAVSMFMRTSQRLGAIVATAGGLAGAIAIAYTLYTIAVIVGALLSVRWGLPGVAVSTAVALVVCYGACSAPALRYSGLSVGSFLVAHGPGLALSGLLLLVLWPAAGLLRDVTTTPVVFVVIVAAAALVALVTIGVALRARYGDFAWLRDELERVIRKRRPQRT